MNGGDRPTVCPTCGQPIGMLAPIVQLGKGPWTCEDCDGRTTMKAWTDYPIVELGDTPGMRAPVRECEVTEYDGDKYCRVVVGGHSVEIKSGYLYTQPGRFAEVPQIDVTKLEKTS